MSQFLYRYCIPTIIFFCLEFLENFAVNSHKTHASVHWRLDHLMPCMHALDLQMALADSASDSGLGGATGRRRGDTTQDAFKGA